MNEIVKNKLKKSILVILSASIAVGLAISFGCGQGESLGIKEATFAALEEIRLEKQNELTAYFESLEKLTTAAASDSLLTNVFSSGYETNSDMSHVAKLEDALDIHFVNVYGKFYDLLWVDTFGNVVHTIRRESDYHTNLYETASDTRLAQELEQADSPTFVDFEQYLPSDEPGAFYIVPVYKKQQLTGRMVFQLSVNRINTTLTNRRSMGRTGEVYLVSSSGLMLTQSRFARTSTILNKRIETEPIKAARKAESGNLLTTDYRDVRVFSSFARINVFEVVWYVVAEIDEAEVLTAHYTKHQGPIQRELLQQLLLQKHQSPVAPSSNRSSYIKVDMGEYGAARPGQELRTFGVATCTAVSAVFPGRFAYLAHVTPVDEAYKSDGHDLFGTNDETNLLSRLLDHIQHYDLLPYEVDSVQFVVTAVHDESCWNIIDKLIRAGFMVDQIKLMYNPEAQYANVTTRANDAGVTISWLSAEDSNSVEQLSKTTPDLGSLMRTFTY